MTIQDATQPVLGDGTVAELADALRGEAIRPGDATYDQARQIWNGAHDRRPALIAHCAGVADVIRAVELVRSQNLLVAVRGGAHSIPGFSTCDAGIVIDLSSMNSVRVDLEAGTARAEAGATWSVRPRDTGVRPGDDRRAGVDDGHRRFHPGRRHRLVDAQAWPHVRQPHRGRRRHRRRPAGARERGGEPGLVLGAARRRRKLRRRHVARVPRAPGRADGLRRTGVHPGNRAGEIYRFYRDWTREAPDELTTICNLATAPPAPFLPEEWHGQPVVVIAGMHCGSLEDGERAVAPLRQLGDPVADLWGPLPYAAMQSLLDPLYGAGAHNYFKAGWLAGLDDDTIDTMVDRFASVGSPMTEVHVHHVGGAVAQVPADATAFGERGAPFLLNILARTPTAEGYDAAVDWAQDLYAATEPAQTGGTYVNFLSAEGADRARAAYRETSYDRLVALKDRYDPTNLLRLNQNILPSRT